MYELSGRNYSYFSISSSQQSNEANLTVPQVFDYSNDSNYSQSFLIAEDDKDDMFPNQNNYEEIIEPPVKITKTSEYNYSKSKSNSVSKSVKLIDLTSDEIDVPTQPDIWDEELYNFTISRTLNKQKFLSPAQLTGVINNNKHYNYSYYNNQIRDDPEIIDHSKQTKSIINTQKKNEPLFPIKNAPKQDTKKSFVDKQTMHINSLFLRSSSSKYVIILRGLPGSGKSGFCQAFKNKEIEMGRVAPRVLSLDPFFIEDGEFDYDPEMEETYIEELFKTFKRQIDEGYYSMIIVDSVNYRINHFRKFYNYAEMHLFKVCVLELKVSANICAKRSELKYESKYIYQMSDKWEELPIDICKLDASSFLQDTTIEDVEMEDIVESPKITKEKEKEKVKGKEQEKEKTITIDDSEESESDNDEDIDEIYLSSNGFFKSKWEEDFEDTKEIEYINEVRPNSFIRRIRLFAQDIIGVKLFDIYDVPNMIKLETDLLKRFLIIRYVKNDDDKNKKSKLKNNKNNNITQISTKCISDMFTKVNDINSIIITVAQGNIELKKDKNEMIKLNENESLRLKDLFRNYNIRIRFSNSFVVCIEGETDIDLLPKLEDNELCKEIKKGKSFNLLNNNELNDNTAIINVSWGGSVTNLPVPLKIGIKIKDDYKEITVKSRERVSSCNTHRHGIKEEDLENGKDTAVVRQEVLELIKNKLVIGFEPEKILDYLRIPLYELNGLRCLRKHLCGQISAKNVAFRQLCLSVNYDMHTLKTTKWETELFEKVYEKNKEEWIDPYNINTVGNIEEFKLKLKGIQIVKPIESVDKDNLVDKNIPIQTVPIAIPITPVPIVPLINEINVNQQIIEKINEPIKKIIELDQKIKELDQIRIEIDRENNIFNKEILMLTAPDPQMLQLFNEFIYPMDQQLDQQLDYVYDENMEIDDDLNEIGDISSESKNVETTREFRPIYFLREVIGSVRLLTGIKIYDIYDVPNRLRLELDILRRLVIIKYLHPGLGHKQFITKSVNKIFPITKDITSVVITVIFGVIEIKVGNNKWLTLNRLETFRIKDSSRNYNVFIKFSHSILITIEAETDCDILPQYEDNALCKEIKNGKSFNLFSLDELDPNSVIINASWGETLSKKLIPIKIGVKSNISYEEIVIKPRERIFGFNAESRGVKEENIDKDGKDVALVREQVLSLIRYKLIIGFEPEILLDYLRIPLFEINGLRCLYKHLCSVTKSKYIAFRKLCSTIYPNLPVMMSTQFETVILEKVYEKHKTRWIDAYNIITVTDIVDFKFKLSEITYVEKSNLDNNDNNIKNQKEVNKQKDDKTIEFGSFYPISHYCEKIIDSNEIILLEDDEIDRNQGNGIKDQNIDNEVINPEKDISDSLNVILDSSESNIEPDQIINNGEQKENEIDKDNVETDQSMNEPYVDNIESDQSINEAEKDNIETDKSINEPDTDNIEPDQSMNEAETDKSTNVEEDQNEIDEDNIECDEQILDMEIDLGLDLNDPFMEEMDQEEDLESNKINKNKNDDMSLINITKVPPYKNLRLIHAYFQKFNGIQIFDVYDVPNRLRVDNDKLRQMIVIKNIENNVTFITKTIGEMLPDKKDVSNIIITVVTGMIEINNDKNEWMELLENESIKLTDIYRNYKVKIKFSDLMLVSIEGETDTDLLPDYKDNELCKEIKNGRSFNLFQTNELDDNSVILNASLGATATNKPIPLKIAIKMKNKYHEIILKPRERVCTIYKNVHDIKYDDIDNGKDIAIVREEILGLIKNKIVIGFEPEKILDYLRIPLCELNGLRCLRKYLNLQNFRKNEALKKLYLSIYPCIPSLKTTKWETEIFEKVYEKHKNRWIDPYNFSSVGNIEEFKLKLTPLYQLNLDEQTNEIDGNKNQSIIEPVQNELENELSLEERINKFSPVPELQISKESRPKYYLRQITNFPLKNAVSLFDLNNVPNKLRLVDKILRQLILINSSNNQKYVSKRIGDILPNKNNVNCIIISVVHGSLEVNNSTNQWIKLLEGESIRICDQKRKYNIRVKFSKVLLSIEGETDINVLPQYEENSMYNRIKDGKSFNLLLPEEMDENTVILNASYAESVNRLNIPFIIGIRSIKGYEEIMIKPRERITFILPEYNYVKIEDIDNADDISLVRENVLALLKNKLVVGFEPENILNYFHIPFCELKGLRCLHQYLCPHIKRSTEALKYVYSLISTNLPLAKSTKLTSELFEKIYEQHKSQWVDPYNINTICNENSQQKIINEDLIKKSKFIYNFNKISEINSKSLFTKYLIEYDDNLNQILEQDQNQDEDENQSQDQDQSQEMVTIKSELVVNNELDQNKNQNQEIIQIKLEPNIILEPIEQSQTNGELNIKSEPFIYDIPNSNEPFIKIEACIPDFINIKTEEFYNDELTQSSEHSF